MDDEHICYYLLAWRMYVHILAMYAAGFFFFIFILINDYERGALNKRVVDQVENENDENQVDDYWLQQHDNSATFVRNTTVRTKHAFDGPPPKRQHLTQVAIGFLKSFDSKMDAVITEFAKFIAKLPDLSKRDLVEEVKKLGLTKEEEIDLVVKFAHNQQFEKFFWELQGPQRMSFVRKIMKM